MRFIPLCSLFCLPRVFTHCPSEVLPWEMSQAKAIFWSSGDT
ncbi:brain protein I3, isoform CRA_b, partial [Rattus norvegicus]